MLCHQSPALFLAWIAWCALHSLLASRRVRGILARAAGLGPTGYRFGYVLFSSATLIPLIYWQLTTVTLPARAGLAWQLPRLLLILYGAYMFRAGARAYDLGIFLGLTDRKDSAPVLIRSGILEIVRHPWYSGGIALVAALGESPLDRWDWRLLLVAYLVLGCLIEERRLVAELGEDYRKYRRNVPMLLPIGRLGRKKKTGASRLPS